MSTTVYTYNNKVLVNSANDKWLKKPEVVDYVTIGTQTWKTTNLAVPIAILNNDYIIRDGKYYYNIRSGIVRGYITANYPGWHIPTIEEFNTLKTTVNNSASALAEAGFSIDETVGAYYKEDGSWNYLSDSYQYLIGEIYEQYGEDYYAYFKTSSSALIVTTWGDGDWEGHLVNTLAMPIRLIQDSN